MTTAAPWAESDRLMRESRRANEAAMQFANINDLGEQALRELLTVVELAKIELGNLDQLIADIRGQMDAAVSKHQATTKPLQEEISDPATSTARRVECRAGVLLANTELEADIAPLKKSLEAAEHERNITRATSSGKTAIENAWVNCGPENERQRVQSLRKALELVDQRIVFDLNRQRESQETAVRHARERQKYRHHFAGSEAEQWQEKLQRSEAVLDVFTEWTRQARAELDEIRTRRLKELYD